MVRYGTSEINYFRLEIPINHNVLRLEVSVGYFVGIKEAKSFCNLVRKFQSCFKAVGGTVFQEAMDVLAVIAHINGIVFVPGLFDQHEILGHKRGILVLQILKGLNFISKRIYGRL